MARVRNWDALSLAYRNRLLNGGITRAQYEAGASLKRARGHENTPEHPERAPGEEYRKYRDRRNKLVDQVQELKRQEFGNRVKWNDSRSRKYVAVDPGTGKPRGIRELKAILKEFKLWIDDDRPDDWQGLNAISDGEHESALYYH